MRCIHDIHPPQEEQTSPSCGTAKTVFGPDVTEELEMIPAKCFVVHYPNEAERILAMIGGFYAVESRAKRLGLSQEKLLACRQRFSRRRLERLRGYLDELSVQVLPRSPMGKAISYTLKNWKALNRYTEAAWLDMDNNHSERQIKQLVMGRQAWLFAGSKNGARNTAILLGLIVTCKLAGVAAYTIAAAA
jgi:transposase